MSSSVNQNWLDPYSEGAHLPEMLSVSQSELGKLSSAILAEPLVAQRLITAGQHGLAVDERSSDPDYQHWGHSLTSVVTVLLPSPDASTSSSEKRKRRKYQEHWLNNQSRWPDLASTSNATYLLCADNRPPEIGLPKQLYPGSPAGELADFQGFHPLLDALTKSVSPIVAPAWMHEKPGAREALATILSETFKNTHDHARHEIDKSDVAQSLRGIYSRFYDLDEISTLSNSAGPEDVTPALRFARSFLPLSVRPGIRVQERVAVSGVLEISIFDSGPGMAAKWLNRSTSGVTAQDQLNAVISCFEKGRTTTGTQGRGFGLAKVLLKLRELRAFISVRTNEIHVYRQFSDHPSVAQDVHADGTRVPAEKLFDWRKGWSLSPSTYPSVRGTVISFLIPMAGA